MKKRNRFGQFIKTGRFVKCQICQNLFWIKNCHENKAKYCSRKCAAIYNIGKKQSPAAILKRISKITGLKRTKKWKDERSKRFRGKNNPNWKSGIYEKNGRGRRYKEFIFGIINKKSKCAKCGTRKFLEIDHIIPWSVSKILRFNKNNIQILCRKDHLKKSRIDGKKYWKNQYGRSCYWENFYKQRVRH